MSLRPLLDALATDIATDVGLVTRLVTGSSLGTDLSGLNTTQKGSLVAALNELLQRVNDAAASGGAVIDDSTARTSTVYSSSKVVDVVTTAIAQVTAGAPGALDTLDELAAALGDDPNFAASITTALANRLRLDDTQTLTEAQRAQGRANLGAVASADVGDTTSSLVAVYRAAKS